MLRQWYSLVTFKKNEITELIGNKDPLGLNSDINNSNIESYTTIKTKTNTEILI